MNPDQLRMREDATTFLLAFFEAGRPVSAIYHGPRDPHRLRRCRRPRGHPRRAENRLTDSSKIKA